MAEKSIRIKLDLHKKLKKYAIDMNMTLETVADQFLNEGLTNSLTGTHDYTMAVDGTILKDGKEIKLEKE